MDERIPQVGDAVFVVAVDWCRHQYQIALADIAAEVHLKRASLYGVIVKLDDEMIAIAQQVFHEGDCREVLAIPLGCVESVQYLSGGEVIKPGQVSNGR